MSRGKQLWQRSSMDRQNREICNISYVTHQKDGYLRWLPIFGPYYFIGRNWLLPQIIPSILMPIQYSNISAHGLQPLFSLRQLVNLASILAIPSLQMLMKILITEYWKYCIGLYLKELHSLLWSNYHFSSFSFIFAQIFRSFCFLLNSLNLTK